MTENSKVLIVPEIIEEENLNLKKSKEDEDDVFFFGRTLLEIVTRTICYDQKADTTQHI